MTGFYAPVLQLHVLAAWCSMGLFVTRGALFQFGSPRVQEIAKDARLLVLVFGVNACLIFTGLSLWGFMGYSLPSDWWLAVKLAALIGYAISGHWAMSQQRLHLLGYVTALALLLLAMDLSINRQFMPG